MHGAHVLIISHGKHWRNSRHRAAKPLSCCWADDGRLWELYFFLEVIVDALPPLSTWILLVKSLSMLDGQRRRAYVMFLLEGVVIAIPRAIPTSVASF